MQSSFQQNHGKWFFYGSLLAILLAMIAFSLLQNIYAQNIKETSNVSAVLKADFIRYDDNLANIIASGNIYVSMGNYILRADRLYYNIQKDLLFAEGNVRIKDEEERIIIGKRAILKDRFKEAIIDEFTLKLPNEALLMAVYADKENNNKVNLHKANFTPCKILCWNQPIWQIKAENMNIDYEKEQITYKNMFFEVFGIPIAYSPYFFHPTTNALAKSGFLTPKISKSQFVLPLYYRAKSNLDFTLSPRIAKNSSILEGQIRHLIKEGSYEINGSYADNKYANYSKYTFFSKGNFSKNNIEYGFDINTASDKAYLVNNFKNYDSYLESKIYANQIVKTDYLSLESYFFQNFQVKNGEKDKSSFVFPRVRVQKLLPLNDDKTVLFKIKNDFSLYNQNYETQIARNSLELNLSKKVITPNGHLLNFALNGKNDLYWLSYKKHLNNNSTETEEEKLWARIIPEVHAIWRYPLSRSLSSNKVIKLEPIFAAFIGKNYNKNYNRFTFIDTSKYELSEYNFLKPNKFSGIDYHEYGQRFNYGINNSVSFGSYYVNVFLGRLFHHNNIQENSNSNYVGNLLIDVNNNFNLYYRFRKDKKLNHVIDEMGASANINRLTASVNFSKLHNISRYYTKDTSYFPKNKATQTNLNASYQLFDSLKLGIGTLLDNTEKYRTLHNTMQVTYTIDCVSITVRFYNDFTNDVSRKITKNTSKTFLVGLKVLNM